MSSASASTGADVTSVAILGKDNGPLYIREFAIDDQQHQQDESELLFDLPMVGCGTDTASGTATSKCSVRQQFIMYAALDRLDQLAGPPPGYGWRNNNKNSVNNGGADGMFVGLLCPAEDQRVYGYVSTTKIKFLLVTEDDGTSNPVSSSTSENDSNSENIKLLLTQIHELYIEDMLNPFKIIGSPITSRRFERRIEELVQTFNNTSDGMI
eukprot:CAMPEP_0113464350 /NCGR_PEP_ID=MMETSP0014_2-20120614/13158_1 /TAXON_ID=2857 /ORGANISM="Nitzschia sp." /LENGTH=210 /DNA_ID=CAMNT_0000356433 /DNA_START=63 /DNA_END=695 /DNA_ORIENTATION=- /assembly_acc=CAM_ASM_000159